MHAKLLLTMILTSVLLLVPATLLAESYLTGTITAEADDGSGLADWKYTAEMAWDTGTDYGLSHLDLIVDDGTNCDCDELSDALIWDIPPGYYMDEEGECQMGLDAELRCQGDPSVHVMTPLLKFEPNEGPDCFAGPVGEMVIVFWSDYAPAPIAAPNLFLVDKYSNCSEFGMITGMFPGLPCDPVSDTTLPWSGLKAIYR